MSDQFLELETDEDAIASFRGAQNARTSAVLCDAQFDADVELAIAVLENPDAVNGVSRRGDWVYTFLKTEDAPRGRWLRVPDGTAISRGADWQVVFDVDAFCEATDVNWHWRGARTAWFKYDRVMLVLSHEGSDQSRYLEFDLESCSLVEGGFDLEPSRSSVSWIDADTLLVSSAVGDDGTESSWPGVARIWSRGTAFSDAEAVFSADKSDLALWCGAERDTDGTALLSLTKASTIGKAVTTVRRSGQDDVVLAAPEDTTAVHDHSHFAYIVQSGPDAGCLMLGAIGAVADVLVRPKDGLVVSAASLMFQDGLLIWKQSVRMAQELWVRDLVAGVSTRVALPSVADAFYVYPFDANSDAGDGTLVLSAQGFAQPSTQYLFDLKNGVDGIDWREVYRAPDLFDADGVEVQLHEAKSADGTMVPYHLVLPKGAVMGAVPTLIYGYGGYGVSLAPYYSGITGKLWLEKGGACVMAYIRGGAELGPEWHLSAKGAGRDRAFEDFAAISDDLVARGVSTPAKIACHGGSNGGLLCGVMLTRYPEKFGAIWASVGVYDMLRFHKFPAGRAWIDEYGDPGVAEDAAWLRAYSPLHQVNDGPYPATLIDTSSHDDRVDPSHSRRFVAALNGAGQQPWYYEHEDGGHGGGGASRAKAKEVALGHRFLWHAFG
ncbi:MAG: S9 family peptidase [Amylibacter sp.]|nr:S9 family peptidase [Amylibacter sp.]